MAGKVITLGTARGEYRPAYEIVGYRDGDPRRRIHHVNWRSITAIQTSKAIGDIAGTFTITLKDKRTRHQVREMDVLRIRLRGHYDQRHITVLKGVVDEVRPAGSADVYAGTEDTVVTGRCVAKYLQSTSLFLPVWDPESNLPTALTFGYGDAARKVDGNRPFDINRYLVKRFTYGDRKIAGVSGIPNSRYWLDHYTRFARRIDFRVPFLQFDEVSVADAFKQLELTGFTEAWVDELGRQVYRQPPWDAPVTYLLPTSQLKDWAFARSDVEAATYVEVIPAADPGIDSTIAQALRAGRAPVPSSYLGAGDTTLAGTVTPEFVVDTDSRGVVTERGRRNHWYRLQRRLGLRPQQITSPLLATQEQAQRQAEGLLRYLARASKTMQVVIPGAPEVRLGYTIRVRGELEDVPFDRTFYIEQVSHDYYETEDGGSYTTTITGTHGRDRWDPGFPKIVLPTFDPAQLVEQGGILEDGSNDGGGGTITGGSKRQRIVAAARDALARKDEFRYAQVRPMPKSLTASGTKRTDCSGFVTLCYKAAGLPDPNALGYNGQGYTGTLCRQGRRTSTPSPGDVAFYGSGPPYTHAEIYIGNGRSIGFGNDPISEKNVNYRPVAEYRTYIDMPTGG